MEQWFFDFVEYPYGIRPEPMLLPDERIMWDRDDLDDKENVDRFIKAISEGRSVGLRIYGDSGAGKTWLVRYIKKRLESEMENPIIFYNRIVGAKSTFEEFYFDLITAIIPQLGRLLSVVEQKIGDKSSDWIDYWDNHDLGEALRHIQKKDDHEGLSKDWLKGTASSAAIKPTGIITKLDTDFQKVEVLQKLLHKASELFSTCVLVLDEIALVKRGFGRELGRIVKDIFDGFYEKFGLICTYTGVTSDTLLDNYDSHFYERFEHEVGLKTIKKDYLPTFLRLHHQSYRKTGAEIKDQLYPFTESAVYKLIDLIDPESLFPRSILKSCGVLAIEATERAKTKIIDEKFVEKNAGLIPPDVRVRA